MYKCVSYRSVHNEINFILLFSVVLGISKYYLTIYLVTKSKL